MKWLLCPEAAGEHGTGTVLLRRTVAYRTLSPAGSASRPAHAGQFLDSNLGRARERAGSYEGPLAVRGGLSDWIPDGTDRSLEGFARKDEAKCPSRQIAQSIGSTDSSTPTQRSSTHGSSCFCLPLCLG